MKDIRTRFAPSPTGFLHIGGLRTALFCYAWAKKNNGTFILRIEDTDQARYVEGAVEQILQSLHWAGIKPDEGIVLKDGKLTEVGEHGPYVQSQRIDLYKKFAQELLKQEKAYKCWCKAERLDSMRAAQRAAKQMPKYDRHCYHLSDEQKQEKEASQEEYVIRFLVPDVPSVSWNDVSFGKMEFEIEQVDDFVMLKADGFPTYNFANVIDDHDMQISHVIRGQEFLSSTPKHILLYQAYDWDVPKFVHVAWILGKNKHKLSKRDNSVSVDDYSEMGILPQALNNYLALLGWNPNEDKEIFTLEEFIDKFDLVDVQKSGAVFDLEKLYWMNGQYIRSLGDNEYTNLAIKELLEAGVLVQIQGGYMNSEKNITLDKESVHRIVLTEKARIKTFQDLISSVDFFLKDKLQLHPSNLVWKKGKIEDIEQILQVVHDKLKDVTDWQRESIQEALQTIVQSTDWGTGDVFWPTRVALSGKPQSPGPDEIAYALGKERTLQRINQAIEVVSR